MKLKIEKILKPLALKEYASVYGETTIIVWRNPPREKRKQLGDLTREFQAAHLAQAQSELKIKTFRKDHPAPTNPSVVLKEESDYQDALQAYKEWILEWNVRVQQWYAEIWSQGDPDTHWTVDEIQTIDREDPYLLGWMIDRTRELLDSKKD